MAVPAWPPPAGRDLPAGAVRALSPMEKLVSLPQYQKLAGKLMQEQVGPAGSVEGTGAVEALCAAVGLVLPGTSPRLRLL